jgi:hypothetical protein
MGSPDKVSDNVVMTVVAVTGNADSVTTHSLTPITARYLRLTVMAGDIARAYEVEVCAM